MEFTIKTAKQQEVININSQIEEIVSKSGVKNGICIVYTPHSSISLLINENADPNIFDDILKTLDHLIPLHDNYKHDRIDNNAAAHIKTSIIGSTSETIPIKDGKLQLGQWQNVFLSEFDGPRERRVIVNIIKS